MFPLGDLARRLLEARYLRTDSHGRVVETPEELLVRVAAAVAEGEERLGAGAKDRWRDAFLELMAEGHFLPSSPTLMNAGTPSGQLSACFVLPVGDRLEAIFDALRSMALIQRTGGGTGFSFSALRPRGAPLSRGEGRSSGPVAFMRLFDATTTALREGGRRRGANMGVLRVDHPDVFEFVRAKRTPGELTNFNLSLGLTDAFMAALEHDRPFPLVHPGTGAVARVVPARALFDELVESAWRSGEPGVVFLDALERANPTPELGRIETTNPCGEVPLLPWESCTLGSLNLAHLVRAGADGPELDLERLRERARLAVRFLDDVVEVNRFPLPELGAAARRTRKLGLGVMGFADALVQLDVPYGSPRAVELAGRIAGALAEAADEASLELAEERGPCPAFAARDHLPGLPPRRNATTTSIAPTGTLSLLVGTTPGIEPRYALVQERSDPVDGTPLVEVDPQARTWLAARGLDAGALERRGTLADVPGVDAHGRALFAIAHEIEPDQHLAIQAAFQARVDNGVAKTVNLPESATPATVERIFRRAFGLGLKGVTVFRAGSDRAPLLARGVGRGVPRETAAASD